MDLDVRAVMAIGRSHNVTLPDLHENTIWRTPIISVRINIDYRHDIDMCLDKCIFNVYELQVIPQDIFRDACFFMASEPMVSSSFLHFTGEWATSLDFHVRKSRGCQGVQGGRYPLHF